MIYDVWRDEEIQCFHWIFFPFPLVYLIYLSDMMSCIFIVHVERTALQIKCVFKLWWPDLHVNVAKISCQVSFSAHSQELQNSPFRLLNNQIFSPLHHKSPALGMSCLPLRHWKSFSLKIQAHERENIYSAYRSLLILISALAKIDPYKHIPTVAGYSERFPGAFR